MTLRHLSFHPHLKPTRVYIVRPRRDILPASRTLDDGDMHGAADSSDERVWFSLVSIYRGRGPVQVPPMVEP